jgi:SAM-dependent methyltransferase
VVRALLARSLAPWPRDAVRRELLDEPDPPPAELAGCLRDIARLNRLGPTHTLLVYLAPFLDRHPPDRPLRVLDLGTGRGDIPAAIVRWGRSRGRRVSVVGLDRSPAVVACARASTAAVPEVRVVAAEALEPPVRPRSVDVAVCSLMLHHLPEEAVVRLLAVMGRVARLGFVISDLRRSRAAWAAAWLLTRAISTNRLTRHDGPLSVRRAYTRGELAALSTRAGLPGLRWHHAIAFRLIGVYERPG